MLVAGWLGELAQPADLSVQHGIPIEAFDLDCPDEDLKANVLQEFILLDDRYVERLDRLEQEYATAIWFVFTESRDVQCVC